MSVVLIMLLTSNHCRIPIVSVRLLTFLEIYTFYKLVVFVIVYMLNMPCLFIIRTVSDLGPCLEEEL